MGMASTIGLRSLSSSSVFLLRAGKLTAPPPSNSIKFKSLPGFHSLFHYRLRCNPSFCTSPNVNADPAAAATAVAPPEVTDGPPKDPIRDSSDLLDIRVGRIIKAWRHEEADSLYVEEVDIGEPEPRTICSGLVKYVPLEQLQDAKVVVLANLKPRNMRGVKSFGMLMAASDAAHENVELLVPPEGSAPGERIWFGGEDEKETQSEPAGANQVQKKKIWEAVLPHLKTDASGNAVLGGSHVMRTSAGLVVSKTLKNANIS